MSRHASPVPLGERWLEADEPGELSGDDLEARLDFWRAREASFVRFAPFDLEGPGARPSPGERGLSEAWFPARRIARDARAILRARFGRALDALDPRWERGVLARAPTWADARRALASLSQEAFPSRFLERIARGRDAAEAFAFEARDPRSSGASLERYPDVLERIAEVAPRPRARAWDAGCATGEGTFALARALAPSREEVAVIGTTPCPFERLMAERRGRPHDRARTLALRERLPSLPENVAVSFRRGDLRDPESSPGAQDVVLVAGVLGGAIFERGEVVAALRTIAGALSPGGRVFVADRFREDRHARAEALVREAAPLAGLGVVGPGELAKPTADG